MSSVSAFFLTNCTLLYCKSDTANAFSVVGIYQMESLHQKSIWSLNNWSDFFVLRSSCMHKCQCRGSISVCFVVKLKNVFTVRTRYYFWLCVCFASVCTPPHLQVVHNHSLKRIFGKRGLAHWAQHRQPHLQPAILT